MENFNFWEAGVSDFWTNVPKGTPLRQIWSNESYVVCASSGVLKLCGAEKTVRKNLHWKLESSITLRRHRAAPRRRMMSVFTFALSCSPTGRRLNEPHSLQTRLLQSVHTRPIPSENLLVKHSRHRRRSDCFTGPLSRSCCLTLSSKHNTSLCSLLQPAVHHHLHHHWSLPLGDEFW